MTITRYSSDWNPAMLVLVAYGLLGVILAFMPMPAHGIFLPVDQLPMIKSMQRRSFDPERMMFFWQGMIIAFPLIFVAFSWLAPIKVTASKVNKAYAIPLSLVGILLFGACVPGFVWALFLCDVDTVSRAGRIVLGTGNGPWDLCYAGSILMIMLLTLTWWAYVAIPISIYKIIVIRSQQQPRS